MHGKPPMLDGVVKTELTILRSGKSQTTSYAGGGGRSSNLSPTQMPWACSAGAGRRDSNRVIRYRHKAFSTRVVN